jgi:hypothetical protein
MALAAALHGSDGPVRKAPEDPARKAPADSLSAILAEPDSGTLSDSLGRFIEARNSDPARLDRELRAAGFQRADEKAGCARYAYTGEPEQLYFLDHTLHVLIEQCGSNPRTGTISVRRGDS